MRVCVDCGHENGDAARFCESCGAALIGAGPVEQRKTVTVVFCDLAGSTALGESVDPERLRGVLAGYFDRMQGIVEGHGGTVEKFIGDAVMAVFGVPVVHEDDALRAVRAAVEMRDALPELDLEGRIGVMTGEVVTGTDERLATGDAVNVAARLEQAAAPGEVLIGQPTLDLVSGVVEVEAVEPLPLKGKSEPVHAHRLVRVLDAPERRPEMPFVGRERELQLLAEAWQTTLVEGRCELATVVGDAGVGKSRLVAEAVAAMRSATVLRARCLPYGEGITYWPVVELLKQLEIVPREEVGAAAISSLLGENDDQTSADEIAWAVRKALERAASEQPVVVVFDDIHWGEETFLDLVEQLPLLSAAAPLLVVCVARPELLDLRPSWPASLRLEPLGDDVVEALIPSDLPWELRRRIARAAAGNPLFVEEMLAMIVDSGDDVAVPPTLRALLAARLDQLEADERAVLQRGSIEGEVFHRGAVQALAPEEGQVISRLAALVRKRLIRPDKSLLQGDDGFRFHHLLLRDAAYEALPKAARAAFHERFARWVEVHAIDLVELDEIVGYHLEQAHGYRVELGMPVDAALVGETRRRLAAAGIRARYRGDHRAAAKLFERALAFVPPGEFDLVLEIGLVDALFNSGAGEAALSHSASLVERATGVGDEVARLSGSIKDAVLRMYLAPDEGTSQQVVALADLALPVFRAAGEDVALYVAYDARAMVDFTRGHTDAAMRDFDQAAIHARNARSTRALGWCAFSRLYGTTPVPDLLRWLDEEASRQSRDYGLRATRAWAFAMLGRFDEARAILDETRSELTELGRGIDLAFITAIEYAGIERLAGDRAKAVELGEQGCRLLEEVGAQSFLSTAAAELSHALCDNGRIDDAEAWASRAAELGAPDDAFTQALWRSASARVNAGRGDHAEAERLVQEALEIIDATDDLNGKGNARADFAEVLLLSDRKREAADALDQALDCYRQKGNLVMAQRVGDRLDELRAAVLP